MKAILEFDLNFREDQKSYAATFQAEEMMLALKELKASFEANLESDMAIKDVYEFFLSTLEDNEVKLI